MADVPAYHDPNSAAAYMPLGAAPPPVKILPIGSKPAAPAAPGGTLVAPGIVKRISP